MKKAIIYKQKVVSNKQGRVMKKIIILLTLFFLWFALTLWYTVLFDESVLSLSYNHSKSDFVQISHDRLLRGEKLSGEFVARENNLGIVSLRFVHLLRIPYANEDILVFRIKEKGANEWYYENEYRSGLTFDVPFLPFGFPVISNSEGKTYFFELESLKGNNFNGVILSKRNPMIFSKYVVDKDYLFSEKSNLLVFSLKKVFNPLKTIDVSYSSFAFSLPLIFYLFFISPFRSIVFSYLEVIEIKLRKYGESMFGSRYNYFYRIASFSFHNFLFIVMVIVTLGDIIFLQIANDLLYISLIALWLVVVMSLGRGNKTSFSAGILLLLIAPLALEFGNMGIAEKAGAWAFMFFIAGTIQCLYEQLSGKEGAKDHFLGE